MGHRMGSGKRKRKIGLREIRGLELDRVVRDAAVPGFGARRQRSGAISYVLSSGLMFSSSRLRPSLKCSGAGGSWFSNNTMTRVRDALLHGPTTASRSSLPTPDFQQESNQCTPHHRHKRDQLIVPEQRVGAD
jgi:hypothetical protein